MLIGSVAYGLCSAGGFCAGSQIVVDHQVGDLRNVSAPVLIFFSN